jgi:RNA polymerase sigma factor (sigma-70 family)
MDQELSVVDLVNLAREGDKAAWHELVERFAPLVWTVCSRFGLPRQDIDEVGQNVWLALVEHLDRLQAPAALPGWLITVTRRECQRAVRSRRRREQRELYADDWAPMVADPVDIEAENVAIEREHALREAFRQLPARCQELLELLTADPPLSYDEIGSKLDMPIGGIGPTRGRCLEKLRHCLALGGWLDMPPESPGVRRAR